MTKSTVGSGGNSITSGINVAEFHCMGGRNNDCGATEANAEGRFESAGTASLLIGHLTANGSTAALTLQFRKNEANGSENVSIGAGATGFFEDISNTDSISATDKFCAQYGATTGANKTITVRQTGCAFDPGGSSTVTKEQCNSTVAAGVALTAGSSNFFTIHGGGVSSASTETNCKCRQEIAGTFNNLNVFLSANAATADGTFKSRKNGADGNLTKSITASTSGWFADTVNSDSIAVNDDYCYDFVVGTGGTSTVTTASAEYSTTTGDSQFVMAQPDANTQAANATRFFQLCGNLIATGGTAEANEQTKSRAAYTMKELVLNVTVNGITGATCTATFRKNTANGNMTQSIVNAATGIFNDSTHTDVLAYEDLVNWTLVQPAAAGSMQIQFISTWGNLPAPALPLFLQSPLMQWIES